VKGAVEWVKPSEEEHEDGLRLTLKYKAAQNSIRFITWHHKGDYIATVCPDGTDCV